MLLAVPDQAPGWLSSILLGIVEGVTEFLPVSSTGHLIVANRILGSGNPTYEIVIQIGAISAIVFLYRAKLWDAFRTITKREKGRTNLFFLLVIASIPAVAIGIPFNDFIEAVLFSPLTVAVTLVAGGFGLLVLEGWLERRHAIQHDFGEREIENMTLKQAVIIGFFQTLAMIPGTSRSGATIAGALILGYRRASAAEFSFLLGLPVLYGAALLTILKDWEQVSGPLLSDLLIGIATSFVAALLIVGPFVRYLQKHSFRSFAWYRIIAGSILLGLVLSGTVQ